MTIKMLLTWLAATIGLMVGITFLFYKAEQPPTNQAVSNGAKAVVDITSKNVGTISVDSEQTTEFNLSNSGVKPLKVLKISSSCNCTFGQFIYEGKESAEYGMHAPSGYLGEIAPGKNAKIRMIYRPKIMPVYGAVTRDLYITTNDPINPKLTFSMSAKVE